MVDQEQLEEESTAAIEKIVSESNDQELFEPVALENLVNASTDVVVALIERQYKAYEEQLASAGDIMPPEMRIVKITGAGVVNIEFTNVMEFPDNLKDLINEQATKLEDAKRYLRGNDNYISLMMVSKNEEEATDNLASWEVTSVTSKGMDLQLDFK